MVRVTGLEPARLAALEPKSRVSANSTIPAFPLAIIADVGGGFKCGGAISLAMRREKMYNLNCIREAKP